MAGWSAARRGVQRVIRSGTVWAGLVTVVRGVGFILVMAYALRRLPSRTVGLWYVMLNIAGLAGAAVEFGFSSTIARFASYYLGGAAHVPALGLPSAAGASTGPNVAGLLGLTRMAQRLFARFGLLSTALMLAAWMVWSSLTGRASEIEPGETATFLLLALGHGFNMTQFFWMGMLYGLNQVTSYSRFIMEGLLANYAAAATGLRLGRGLTGLAAGHILLNLVPRWQARRRVRSFLAQGVGVEPPVTVSWRDLWPVTWRAGAATACNYVYIHSTTTLCSLFTDLARTGSYALTFQMAILLFALSASWTWVMHPKVAVLRARGENRRVIRLVALRLLLAVATYLAGAVFLVLAGPPLLALLGSRTPLLPTGQRIGVLTLVGLDLVMGVHSAVLQTGNEVPQLPAFAVSAFLTVALVWPLSRAFGIWGVILAPMLSQIVFNYWWTPRLCWKRLLAEGRTPSADSRGNPS